MVLKRFWNKLSFDSLLEYWWTQSIRLTKAFDPKTRLSSVSAEIIMVSGSSEKVIIWYIQIGSALGLFPCHWNPQTERADLNKETSFRIRFYSIGLDITKSKILHIYHSIWQITNLGYLLIFFGFCDYKQQDLYIGGLAFQDHLLVCVHKHKFVLNLTISALHWILSLFWIEKYVSLELFLIQINLILLICVNNFEF